MVSVIAVVDAVEELVNVSWVCGNRLAVFVSTIAVVVDEETLVG